MLALLIILTGPKNFDFGQKHWAAAFISLAADFKDKFLLEAHSAERYI